MLKFLYKKFGFIAILIFFVSISAYAEINGKICDSSNVYKSLKCFINENNLLKKQLKDLNNSGYSNYSFWLRDAKEKCENKINYTSGEGAALVREACYNEEYKRIILEIRSGKQVIKKNQFNDDGLKVTYFPYNTQDHINCLMSHEKKSCSKVNLINIEYLSKIYGSLNQSYGDSVVFPENKQGIILISSPSSSESGRPLINLTSINGFGIKKNISIEASKNILINNYEIFYQDNKQYKKIVLDGNGDFIKK